MIKNIIKKIPFLLKLYHYSKNFYQREKVKKILNLKTNQEKFSEIHRVNFWGNKETVSGPGSNLKNTSDTIYNLNKIIKNYNIKSILDAPCGDFFWMKKVLSKNLNLKYCGIDIVEEIIKQNKKKYSSSNIKFFKKDIIFNLIPESDLIICRDLLIHLSNKDIKAFLLNLKSSNFKYLLIGGYESNIYQINNNEIKTGDFRQINIFKNPINFSRKFTLKFEDHKYQHKTTNYKSFMYLYEKKNIFKF